METPNETPDDLVIWRYMTMERFADLVAGRLHFAAATQFDDAFEGSITDAQMARRSAEHVRIFQDKNEADRVLASISQAFAELRRLTKINCWHSAEHENVAMWERYLPRRACGVAVRSSVGSLRSALRPFRLDPSYGEEGIVVRRVRYLDYESAEFRQTSMEAPFYYKRIEFSDEREVRAVLSLRMAEEFGVPVPPLGVFVGVDSPELIDEVRVSSSCTPSDAEHVRRAG